MTTIIGLSGSVRKGSYNTALLRAAAESAPKGCKIQIESIKEIPLYDGDVEAAQGIPKPAAELKDKIAAADGLLLATPEYNHSIPGAFKNAVDWMSRPAADIARVFGNKPVGLIGASPGRFGTAYAQTAWLPVLHTLGTRPFFGGSLLVSGASKLFDAEGRLTDDELRERLRDYIKKFTAFCNQ